MVFDKRHGADDVHRFVDRLKLFKIGFSWAGPVSLVVPYDLGQLRGATGRDAGTLVRFSLGLEPVDDLIRDCEQALSALAALTGLSGPATEPAQALVETLCRIRRPFSRSQSRFFSVSRLSCSALPLASAISAFTNPPL